jgi:hypothetical protein
MGTNRVDQFHTVDQTDNPDFFSNLLMKEIAYNRLRHARLLNIERVYTRCGLWNRIEYDR